MILEGSIQGKSVKKRQEESGHVDSRRSERGTGKGGKEWPVGRPGEGDGQVRWRSGVMTSKLQVRKGTKEETVVNLPHMASRWCMMGLSILFGDRMALLTLTRVSSSKCGNGIAERLGC
jgi:hypothetical protein